MNFLPWRLHKSIQDFVFQGIFRIKFISNLEAKMRMSWANLYPKYQTEKLDRNISDQIYLTYF